MKKRAIFVEGHTEVLFIQRLCLSVFDKTKLSFQCFKLFQGFREVPFSHNIKYSDPEIHFFIVDVGNDEKVISVVKEQEKKLFEDAYDKIILLRDMYSKKYCECSKQEKLPNKKLINRFVQSAEQVINQMSSPKDIEMFFAIMEVETWFLGMCNIFKKLNPNLTSKFINEKLKMDLEKLDPEVEFIHPTKQVKKIYELINLRYDKSNKVVEKLLRKLDHTDIDKAIKNGKNQSLKNFYHALKNVIP